MNESMSKTGRKQKVSGSCHCNNIAYELETSTPINRIAARTCQCTFCTRHKPRYWSDPNGSLSLKVNDPHKVQLYRFGHRTADFVICSECGVYMMAVAEIDGAAYAVANIDLSDTRTVDAPATASSHVLEESESARTDRRKTNWTPIAKGWPILPAVSASVSSMEIWFDFASTYSYPAVMQARQMEKEKGITFQWRPFLLGPIFKSQGWNDSPFNIYPAKGAYMWRDLERLCEMHRLPYQRPSNFPRKSLTAARIACRFASASWLPAFIEETFRANFAQDADIGASSVLESILSSLELNSAEIASEASTEHAKQLLRDRTEEAAARGIFGAPTFVVDSELFWGSDRLEGAINWYKARNRL